MTDAERYADNHGWMGSSKKHVGVCRLFSEGDAPLIRVKEAVIGVRPRGILSGFLVIVPDSKGTATFIPNSLSANNGSHSFRLRLHQDIRTTGCIASAYMNKDELVVEDMLVWKDEPAFYCKTFPERWAYVQQFFSALSPDPALQRCRIRAAIYSLPTSVVSPPPYSVVEWVPFAPNQRRLIMVPEREAPVSKVSSEKKIIEKKVPIEEPVLARRDAVGPDVYQLWRGTSHLGQALVRTMAVSKALRLCPGDAIPVKVEYHKAFSKWEIVGTTP